MSQPPMIERVGPPRWLNALQGVVGVVVGVLLLAALVAAVRGPGHAATGSLGAG